SSGYLTKEPVAEAVQSGNTITLSGGDRDYGYCIEQGSDSYYFWISKYVKVTSLENDYSYTNLCESARVTGTGITIPYYSIYGTQGAIPRKISYYTWEWNDQTKMPNMDVEIQEEIVPGNDDKIVVNSPYEKTLFTIIDDIPTRWGGKASKISTSDEYIPKAIFMHGVVTQTERNVPNEIKVNVDGVYGGSAPVIMEFKAYVNEDNYLAWQFFHSAIGADDPDPVIEAIYAVPTLNYSFKDAGTVYVRLHSENSSCSKDITYTIVVGESSLDAPNAFSPGASPGVNDEWRVAYKSIIEFNCVIFDRWGVEVCRFSDPSIGWDGYYHGKLAPPGVYFYIIKAKGSDGKEYQLKGDINIIRGKN
ncbi:MAG: gliding motility-associated C-terminal domain-containing protein, partial [Bacteroidales bacterium]